MIAIVINRTQEIHSQMNGRDPCMAWLDCRQLLYGHLLFPPVQHSFFTFLIRYFCFLPTDSFGEYLLSSYYISDTVLYVEDTRVNLTVKTQPLGIFPSVLQLRIVLLRQLIKVSCPPQAQGKHMTNLIEVQKWKMDGVDSF